MGNEADNHLPDINNTPLQKIPRSLSQYTISFTSHHIHIRSPSHHIHIRSPSHHITFTDELPSLCNRTIRQDNRTIRQPKQYVKTTEAVSLSSLRRFATRVSASSKIRFRNTRSIAPVTCSSRCRETTDGFCPSDVAILTTW